MARTPTCVWRISNELLLAIDQRLGEPTDSYVNGAQTWLRDDGPGEVAIEWRLHPVARFTRPEGTGVHDLFASVVFALATESDPPAPAEQLWDGLEAFPAYGDEIEPSPLAAALSATLGLPPDAFGLVDHDTIGDTWERAGGDVSIVTSLLAQLGG